MYKRSHKHDIVKNHCKTTTSRRMKEKGVQNDTNDDFCIFSWSKISTSLGRSPFHADRSWRYSERWEFDLLVDLLLAIFKLLQRSWSRLEWAFAWSIRMENTMRDVMMRRYRVWPSFRRTTTFEPLEDWNQYEWMKEGALTADVVRNPWATSSPIDACTFLDWMASFPAISLCEECTIIAVTHVEDLYVFRIANDPEIFVGVQRELTHLLAERFEGSTKGKESDLSHRLVVVSRMTSSSS